MKFRHVIEVESMAVWHWEAADIGRAIADGEIAKGERLSPAVDTAEFCHQIIAVAFTSAIG